MNRKASIGYLYISPLVIGILLLTVYPVIQVFWMSLNRVELADLQKFTFVGLANYVHLFKLQNPHFGSSLTITVIFVAGSVVLHIVIGLALALLLDARWLKGRGFFRNFYMLPWITAGIMVGYTWRFLFEPRAGVLNYLLSLVHLPAQSWTADPTLALPSIIVANVWRGVPYSLILLTGGLQSINQELYDSAVVDGAGPYQMIARITLPLIKEFILLNLILDTGMTFQVFDTIFAMTGGGPLHRTETFSVLMYYQAFNFGELGMGSAIAMMLLLVSLAIAIIYIRSFRPGRSGNG